MSSPVHGQASLELVTPVCEKGIGKVISAPDSQDLIAGVRAYPYAVWPDDRGYFLEVARMGQGLTASFPQETTQVSAALAAANPASRCARLQSDWNCSRHADLPHRSLLRSAG